MVRRHGAVSGTPRSGVEISRYRASQVQRELRQRVSDVYRRQYIIDYSLDRMYDRNKGIAAAGEKEIYRLDIVLYKLQMFRQRHRIRDVMKGYTGVKLRRPAMRFT